MTEIELRAHIVQIIREKLKEEALINKYRVSPQNFRRKRILTHDKVALLILRGQKFPFQNTLLKFFGELGKDNETPTAGAYCQARQKLKSGFFKYLNDITIKEFYSFKGKEDHVKFWKNRRLLAIDGSILNLPDTPETRVQYSIQVNQYDKKGKVQGLLSCLYDILNNLSVHSSLTEKKAEKKFIFKEHYPYLSKRDIVVLDRAYADFSVFSFLSFNDINFVIRASKNSFTLARTFSNSLPNDPVGGGVTNDELVDLKISSRQRKFVRDNRLKEQIPIRFIRFVLPNGNPEVLITSLLDKNQFPASDIVEIYKLRWEVETYFDRLKNIFEVQRFSTKLLDSILQDFYGIVFLTTLESLLIKEADEELAQESKDAKRMYPYKVNHSVSLSALLDRIVTLFLDENGKVKDLLVKLTFIFKKNPVVVRKGRSILRKDLTSSQKLWYWQYKKKMIA